MEQETIPENEVHINGHMPLSRSSTRSMDSLLTATPPNDNFTSLKQYNHSSIEIGSRRSGDSSDDVDEFSLDKETKKLNKAQEKSLKQSSNMVETVKKWSGWYFKDNNNSMSSDSLGDNNTRGGEHHSLKMKKSQDNLRHRVKNVATEYRSSIKTAKSSFFNNSKDEKEATVESGSNKSLKKSPSSSPMKQKIAPKAHEFPPELMNYLNHDSKPTESSDKPTGDYSSIKRSKSETKHKKEKKKEGTMLSKEQENSAMAADTSAATSSLKPPASSAVMGENSNKSVDSVASSTHSNSSSKRKNSVARKPINRHRSKSESMSKSSGSIFEAEEPKVQSPPVKSSPPPIADNPAVDLLKHTSSTTAVSSSPLVSDTPPSTHSIPIHKKHERGFGTDLNGSSSSNKDHEPMFPSSSSGSHSSLKSPILKAVQDKARRDSGNNHHPDFDLPHISPSRLHPATLSFDVTDKNSSNKQEDDNSNNNNTVNEEGTQSDDKNTSSSFVSKPYTTSMAFLTRGFSVRRKAVSPSTSKTSSEINSALEETPKEEKEEVEDNKNKRSPSPYKDPVKDLEPMFTAVSEPVKPEVQLPNDSNPQVIITTSPRKVPSPKIVYSSEVNYSKPVVSHASKRAPSRKTVVDSSTHAKEKSSANNGTTTLNSRHNGSSSSSTSFRQNKADTSGSRGHSSDGGGGLDFSFDFEDYPSSSSFLESKTSLIAPDIDNITNNKQAPVIPHIAPPPVAARHKTLSKRVSNEMLKQFRSPSFSSSSPSSSSPANILQNDGYDNDTLQAPTPLFNGNTGGTISDSLMIDNSNNNINSIGKGGGGGISPENLMLSSPNYAETFDKKKSINDNNNIPANNLNQYFDRRLKKDGVNDNHTNTVPQQKKGISLSNSASSISRLLSKVSGGGNSNNNNNNNNTHITKPAPATTTVNYDETTMESLLKDESNTSSSSNKNSISKSQSINFIPTSSSSMDDTPVITTAPKPKVMSFPGKDI